MQKEILNFLEKIEEYLLKSNIHIEIVEEIMNFLAHKAIQNNDITKTEIVELVSNKIQSMMKQHIANFDVESCHKPYVMIVCGINGSGKTTTIGKMTNLLKECDWSVMIAACDTYRAAAETQLRDWVSENVDDFITMEKESDTPSKIAIRAYRKACENKKDVLIIDTSGRLQNNQDLMAELFKMKQKLHEISNTVPNDVVLIIDANNGYNAMEQARIYNELIGITGIIATKLDIAKRPGTILSICSKFNIKIFGVCNGENKDSINDLDPKAFADAILCDIETLM